MDKFSANKDLNVNIGELVLECLLSSRIDSITNLVLNSNESWFCHPETKIVNMQKRGESINIHELYYIYHQKPKG